jgi:Arc/MetJ family transcription regulator
MRTTLDIPEALIDEARAAAGISSKTDTVILALRELIRRRRLDELKSMLGRVRLDVDLASSRRRPGRPRRRRP